MSTSRHIPAQPRCAPTRTAPSATAHAPDAQHPPRPGTGITRTVRRAILSLRILARRMNTGRQSRAHARLFTLAGLSGPIAAMTLAVGGAVLWQHGVPPFHPMELMLALVVYSVSVGGVRAGLVSGAIALVCDGYFVLARPEAFQTTPANGVAMALSIAVCVALVASLRRQAEATRTERGRRRSEHAIAEGLRHAQEEMDDALSLTSHELRTPLATIKIGAQQSARTLRKICALADTRPDLGARAPGNAAGAAHRDDESHALLLSALDSLARVDANVQRLDRMIGDLLDASRVRSDHLALDPVPCDLAALVTNVVAEQCALFANRQVVVDAPPRPVLIEADPLRVAQVIGNYLSNAFKYSPAREPITVSLTAARGQARVAVRDGGPGIPWAMRERIWERFERVHDHDQASVSASAFPTGGGLGLGLYLCRGLIERSGGTVGLESSDRPEDHGSTFWLSLPLLCA